MAPEYGAGDDYLGKLSCEVLQLFRVLPGIESAVPHFRKVIIEPHLGPIEKISGEMPHSEGTISFEYDRSDGELDAEILLPDIVSGTFVWKGNCPI